MDDFDKAVRLVRFLPESNTDNDVKLRFYGLYKQATLGDVKSERPSGILDWVAKAKWDAWNANRHMDPAKAKAEYVALLKRYTSWPAGAV